ncbi:MAG: hypothetical protein H6831_02095 [Planctomycetes bacterium]|nr:hypothetical protein [Planctomycetota bacterium]
MLTLEAASLTPPVGLDKLLAELGESQNGFGSISAATGESTLDEFLARCVRDRDGVGSASGGPCLRFWIELDRAQA